MVQSVRNKQIVGGIDRHRGPIGTLVVVAKAIQGGERGDDPIGSDLADAVVARVRNEEIPNGVHGDTKGIRKAGRCCRTIVSPAPRYSVTGDSLNAPVRSDFP